MGACKEYLEAIYEDSAGTLSFKHKNSLYRHLAECEACRAEREILLGMRYAFLKEGSMASMPPADAAQIKARIFRHLSSQGEDESLWSLLKAKVGFKGLIPALVAAACLIFILVRVWDPDENSQLHTVPGPGAGSITEVQGKVTEKELAIIKNLDLLEQLDTVKMLVKVVDNKDVI